jgi:hypothetical protein
MWSATFIEGTSSQYPNPPNTDRACGCSAAVQHTTGKGWSGSVYALLEARKGVDEPLEGGSHVVCLGRDGKAPAASNGHQLLRLLGQQEHIVQPCGTYYHFNSFFITLINKKKGT